MGMTVLMIAQGDQILENTMFRRFDNTLVVQREPMNQHGEITPHAEQQHRVMFSLFRY